MRFPFSRLGTRRARHERGAVLIIAAAGTVMAVFACALGVDIGRIAVDKRNDQGVADVAALDAARALDVLSSSLPHATAESAAQTAAAASAVRNGFTRSDQSVTATLGSLDPVTNAFSTTGNTAVRVVANSFLKHAFVQSGSTLHATAIATVAYKDGGGTPNGTATAGFSVGSTLASLDAAGTKPTLTSMVASMLGISAASLSLVSYQGLANANLSLGALQTALLSAGLNVGSVSQLLSTDITVPTLLTAMASALTAQGNNTAAAEVNDFPIASISSALKVKLGSLLNVTSPSDAAALSGTFNVFQMITGAAELANGSNFISIPVAANIGGLANVTMSVKVISPAQTAIGPVGVTAEDAQIAVRVGLRVFAGLALTGVDVNLTYTSGEAKGTLSSIVCGTPASIGVSATTAAVSVSGTATAPLAGTLTVSSLGVGTTGPTPLSFAYSSEFAPATKHTGAASAGLNLASVSFTGTGLVAGLISAVLNPLGTVFANALNTLNTSLSSVITPVLKQLGLDLASADVAAIGIYPSATDCSSTPGLGQ